MVSVAPRLVWVGHEAFPVQSGTCSLPFLAGWGSQSRQRIVYTGIRT